MTEWLADVARSGEPTPTQAELRGLWEAASRGDADDGTWADLVVALVATALATRDADAVSAQLEASARRRSTTGPTGREAGDIATGESTRHGRPVKAPRSRTLTFLQDRCLGICVEWRTASEVLKALGPVGDTEARIRAMLELLAGMGHLERGPAGRFRTTRRTT